MSNVYKCWLCRKKCNLTVDCNSKNEYVELRFSEQRSWSLYLDVKCLVRIKTDTNVEKNDESPQVHKATSTSCSNVFEIQ